ncbi:MAG TPA: hypothetical protein PKL84_14595, partial [Candidatus Hydrogenedentes bacterium]|nr:hypothetical protein [Candidatus Hydrogenedentota bacterium]
SRAERLWEGFPGAESDFDVLVLVDTLTKEMRRTISDCAWEVGFDAGVVITPVVMTREEAEESPERSSLFMVSVRKEGIPV